MTETISDTSFVTPQELEELAEYLPEQGKAIATGYAKRQAAAIAACPSHTASKMLDLVEALSEYDDRVASHLLVGMLRVAAGKRLFAVERTALRIAGLAYLDGDTFTLSKEGRALINTLVPGARFTLTTDDGAAIRALPKELAIIPTGSQPFAQMHFGEKLFEIAETPLEDMLCFRLLGTKDWTILNHDRMAGWGEIGAEILTRTSDVLTDYITMHTMRLPETADTPNVHRFDLDTIRWWVRIHDGKPQFQATENADWQDLSDDPQVEPVWSIGIRAARDLIPGFDETVRANAMQWVRRMAHAASVTPILSGAA